MPLLWLNRQRQSKALKENNNI